MKAERVNKIWHDNRKPVTESGFVISKVKSVQRAWTKEGWATYIESHEKMTLTLRSTGWHQPIGLATHFLIGPEARTIKSKELQEALCR